MGKISAVLCVVEEELSIFPRALSSILKLADDIVVVDMTSSGIPKELKTEQVRVYQRERSEYVEKVRNYGISKATGDWILILDPDEEVTQTLTNMLKKICADKNSADYYRIPRKNIIFGKWLKHTLWWPDMNIRFFRRGYVSWNEIIHSVPLTKGKGADLPNKEEFAIIHRSYESIEQFLARMNRYTDVQAANMIKDYKFIWKDLVRKPLEEFLSRYFAGEGYKDGLHGLALSGLQAFSEFILYIKVWQGEKFLEQGITFPEIKEETKKVVGDTNWWLTDASIKSESFTASLWGRILRKFMSHND